MGCSQIRKPKNQRSVIGWELKRQLSSPGTGCARSIVEFIEKDCEAAPQDMNCLRMPFEHKSYISFIDPCHQLKAVTVSARLGRQNLEAVSPHFMSSMNC
jgi:hypothetical protein